MRPERSRPSRRPRGRPRLDGRGKDRHRRRRAGGTDRGWRRLLPPRTRLNRRVKEQPRISRLCLHSTRASRATVGPVDVDAAIRTRRTHKAYRPEPVAREVLDELFELATWAPNHNLTVPWRFRVVGTAGARAPEGGGWRRGGGEARPGADAGRRLIGGDRRPRTGRRGSAIDRCRRIHRPPRRPCARARRLLANAGRPPRSSGARRGGRPPDRALRRADPPWSGLRRKAGARASRRRSRSPISTRTPPRAESERTPSKLSGTRSSTSS